MPVSQAEIFAHVYDRLVAAEPALAQLVGNLDLILDNGNTESVATDGTYLWADSTFIDKLSDDEKLFVLAGMAIRLRDDHLGQMKRSKNARLFNIATDYMISQTLIAQGIGEIPGSALYDPRFDGKSLDEIVAYLDNDVAGIPITDAEIDAALAHPKATREELEAVRAAVSQTIRDATQPLTPRRELDRELSFLTNFGWNGLTDDEVNTLLTALRPITIRLATEI